MGKSTLENYFKYVQDVLGIKQIFSKSAVAEITKSKHITVLITVTDFKSYNLDENNLLEKMVAALKLEPDQLSIIDRSESPPISRYRLNLCDQIDDHQTGLQTVYNTWSPRYLLQNPGLKKEAWAVMQGLLQKINN